MDGGLLRLLYPLALLISVLCVPYLLGQGILSLWLLGSLASVTPRKSYTRVARRLVFTAAFILMGTLPLLFMTIGAEGEALISLGGWGITEESLGRFGLVSLRCFGGFVSILILTTLIPIYSLMHKLRSLGIPALVVELAELIYRYLNIMGETATNIYTSQRCRLGYASWGSRTSHSSMLLAQTFVLAHSDAERVYQGMLSRGYDEGTEPSPLVPTSSPDVPQSNEVLRLEKVSFGYEKGKSIVCDLSLSIHSGERIVVLGQNGAGKSTLFGLLSGIHRADSGCVYLKRRAVEKSTALRRSVGFVFQNAAHQLFTPSVADEIAFGLKNIGWSGAALESKVDQILKDFELVPLMKTPPHLLSEGQKKWVTIAAIMAMDPEVLILDEPTAGLDRYFSEKIIALLNDLCTYGRTVIISTHDMDFAYEWAQRGVVLHEGKLIADQDIASLFGDTSTLEIAHLSPPHYAHRYRHKSLEAAESCPIFLSSHNHRALIVGGGSGAYRKACTLARHAIDIDIISPEVSEEIKELILAKGYTHLARTISPSDVWQYSLVVAATGTPSIDTAVSDECHKRNILVNNLSSPSQSTFSLGATVSHKHTTFAVQTKYSLPEVAQILRDKYKDYIDSHLDDELLMTLSQLRQQMISAKRQGATQEYKALKAQYDMTTTHLTDTL